MGESETYLKSQNQHVLAEKLSAAGWGVFFIWAGIAFLAGMSWGAGLLGVGVIVIAGEAGRKFFGLSVNWFWMTMGSLFIVWAACELLTIRFSGALLPILSIIVGLAILVSVLRPRHNRQGTQRKAAL